MLVALLAFAASTTAIAQNSDPIIAHRLFLVGDAGEQYVRETRMGRVVRKHLGESAENATVVFLGDNIYPAGLSDKGSATYDREQAILREQVSWVEGTGSRAVFVPGNHDWQHWGKKGLQYVKNQQSWFDSLQNPLFSFLPRENCPGPVEISLGGPNLLIILDTQWFLHKWEKPGEGSSCDAKTRGQVIESLGKIIARNPGKRVIIAGHHPLVTYGDHGGVFTWKDHLFPLTDLRPYLYVPLPVIGSIYPLYRKLFGHVQDTRHPLYREFREPIQELLKKHPGNLYVAGHEHALQHIVRDSTHFIVSGGGAKHTSVKHKRHARFVAGATGFVQADLYADGSMLIRIIQVDRKHPDGTEIYNTIIPAIAQ